MAASAILLMDMDVAYDSPATLGLPRRNSYGLVLLNYKMQFMDGVELYCHLSRVHADTACVLLTPFAAVVLVAPPPSGRSFPGWWSSDA